MIFPTAQRRIFSKHLILATLLVAAGSIIHAEDNAVKKSGKGKTVRLLTIGNSFSGNAAHYLPDVVKAAGNVLVYHTAAVGGSPLELHWGKVEKFEKDPKDKDGLYSGGRSLKQELQSEKWDFVTIQQASIKSHDISTYRPFAGKLRDYIKKYAPDAELLMHETWEYRRDDPRFSVKAPKPGEPATQQAMYEMLSNAYATIAKELGVRRIPVGDAFHLANNDTQWGYKTDTSFDPKTAKEPALPDQTHSLNNGWAWKVPTGKKTPTLGMDGHHANVAGEYLGACTFYEVLYGESIIGNSFIPKGLNAADAKYLQETAHRVVEALHEKPVAAAK